MTSNKRLALANKESLVVGGDLLMPLAQPGQLIPVDSEHSAIFQCYLGENPREAHCIWLTCSGGPFFGRTRDELDRVTRADALAHPTWAMGAKITIDSATLMNKGLERIEAMHLFNCDLDFINVVVQRQSKIHSMVEFSDGSVMAHLGASDMRIPIQFAFSYPERWDTPAPRIDFRELGQLTFDAADMNTFRCLALAERAGKTGVTVPMDTNVIGQVDEGSIAAKAGIEGGDAILSVDGVSCSTWMDVYDAIGKAAGKDDIAIEYERDGKQHSTSVALKEDERLGVYASTQVVRLDLITSARLSFSYVVQTAEGVMRLLQPQHTMEILDQSSSIVGISVMSSQAAAAGPATFLSFAALISFSLGFMNLLPIPPLDGGKLVIEIIQKIAGRELPLKVQTIVSYVGIALFALLFVYMLRSDVLRFIL